MKRSPCSTLYIVLLFGLFFQSACYTPRYVYSPAAQNIPLLTEKGDSKLGVLYSTNLTGSKTIDNQNFRGYSKGIDVHGAYAINKRFALQANYFSRSEMNGGDYTAAGDSSVIRYKRNLTELGAGYYTQISGDKTSGLYVQIFGGAGFGKFSFTDNSKDNNNIPALNFHQANILKFYIQPAILFQSKKKVQVAMSSRFSMISYNNIKTDYSEDELLVYELSELGRGPIVFWEPAFVHTFGFSNFPVRLEYQLGLSILMSHRFVDARSFNFSLGLQTDIARLLKKKRVAVKKD
ncbi:MAG: hypothetical protein EOO13_09370 [Chitinophagaceae bacterium]|nr:MAG: hypothetical protein EOO13_09370 [Chitinophagaceae bacterium]